MKDQNNGMALIMVIVITAFMMTCCSMILSITLMEFKTIMSFKHYNYAYSLAEAGAEYGLAEIRKQTKEASIKYLQDRGESEEKDKIKFDQYLKDIPIQEDIVLQNSFLPNIKHQHKITLHFSKNSHNIIVLQSEAELFQKKRTIKVELKLPLDPSQDIVIQEFSQYN